jgi:hypothetical protein
MKLFAEVVELLLASFDLAPNKHMTCSTLGKCIQAEGKSVREHTSILHELRLEQIKGRKLNGPCTATEYNLLCIHFLELDL